MNSEMPVYLAPWDPSWPSRFEQERQALLSVLPPVVAIEHIGSTAVSGLESKPVIDIMVLISDIGEFWRYHIALDHLDYRYFPYAEKDTPKRRFLCKPKLAYRTHHLHVVEHDSREHHQHLAFRDRLRSDAEVRDGYLALKRSLAAEFKNDREAYTQGKSEFIRKVLGT